MLSKYGFIFYSPQADPAVHRAAIASGGLSSLIVAAPEPSAAPAIAKAMVADGVELIELCGAFPAAVVAQVIEAVGGDVPVGAVAYGAESADKLATIVAGEPS